MDETNNKKTTTKRKKRVVVEHRERRDMTKLCAFWGIVFSGVAMFIGFFIGLLNICGVTISWANTLQGVCSMVSMIALLITVAFPAYDYCRGRGKNWKVVYWVALILYICGIVGIGFTL